MQMGKTLARATLFFTIVCATSFTDLGSSLSTRVAVADVIETQLPLVPSCTRLGDNLINNRFIESVAVVGLAGTALTLFSRPESERNLASNCIPGS